MTPGNPLPGKANSKHLELHFQAFFGAYSKIPDAVKLPSPEDQNLLRPPRAD
jgi:hypothetical protein